MNVLSAPVLILMALAGCTACGPDESNIDPKFEPLIRLYIGHAPNKGAISGLRVMQSGDPGHGLGGYTAFRESVVAGVRIEQWTVVTIAPDLSECEWKKTVMHELGHALHDLPHSDDPGSIMHNSTEQFGDDRFWCDHMDEKLIELWSK